MAFSFLPELVISTLVLCVAAALYIVSRVSKNPLLLVDWPIVGILPSLIGSLHNFHDNVAFLLASSGYNFKARAASTRLFLTCDPANVRHIFTSNYANYPKGEEVAEILDVLSGSFITVDGETWRRQRAKIQSILKSPRLLDLMAECCRNKVEKGLVPFLTRMMRTETPFDMQDLIMRFVFDMVAMPVLGVDPNCLSLDMPPVHVPIAMDMVMEVAFFRHIVPAYCWKAMRRLNVGPERKLVVAHRVLRGFMNKMVERRKINRVGEKGQSAATSVDILSSYINDSDYNDDSLRATLIAYITAGRDTVSTALLWLFYILAKNPHVISDIRNELSPIASRKEAYTGANGPMMIFEPEETKPLVYLHATLLESLRLYPPIPLERKTAVVDDLMPSGHKVCADEIIFISLYAMGRMRDVWGEDYRKYRPERWLSEDRSKLRYVPSHKFLVFNSGPRMCLGKDMAMVQMKTVVAAIVWNFDMEMLEGQVIMPKLSGILQMENGLVMKVKKREM